LDLKKLKINLYGESWTLKKFECSTADFNLCINVAEKMKLSLEEALLSPFFYYNLKLPNIPSLEFLPAKKISGLLNTPLNQIEIWYDGIRIKKLNLSDFNQEDLLFPIYNVEKFEIDNKFEPGIYIEQKAFGLVASYEVTVVSFNIEKLHFRILELTDKTLLQKITYDNQKLKLKKKDVLIRYQNGFEVKVVIKDNKGGETIGQVWNFKTN
jgi:hypothetical protein